jgi:hypothetical protein
LFQNWGDYANMSQAVVIYVIMACDVLLICWFGTQLTQEVRVNGLLLLFLECKVENVGKFQQIGTSSFFSCGLFSVISGLLFLKIDTIIPNVFIIHTFNIVLHFVTIAYHYLLLIRA